MTALNKHALTDEAISQAFTGTNFGRDDLRNILAETVIDAAAGWRCGHTATTICTQLGLLTATGRASALGLRFVSEHVCRETKRLKGALEAAERRIAELEAREVTLPAEKFCPSEYAGSQYWEETEVWNKAISGCAAAIRAAGIGVKGE
ncbi:hypothetical protein RM437_00550 [Citrobacter werkmanii]|uniref:hypothetical protein n=1 Tax=Citrobacter werkmanii TaxID=67827 RepID=UPI0028879159|nr:hypothetical protein [Citrobacter werkmanii]MDT0636529.1 hypothetical protein [Citrobacter werkmanii]